MTRNRIILIVAVLACIGWALTFSRAGAQPVAVPRPVGIFVLGSAQHLTLLLAETNNEVELESFKQEKYGRFLAVLWGLEAASINDRMIEAGHAHAYDGSGVRMGVAAPEPSAVDQYLATFGGAMPDGSD